MEPKERLEDFPGEPRWYECLWWSIQEFFENWIYPAYSLSNLVFRRYDLVKLSDIKRTEYCDVVERMFLANMELIKYFVEKENPTERIEWYGEYGHKYGECEEQYGKVLFPEYKGKYVWDIIVEIYNWWRFEYIKLCKEKEYLLGFCSDYCFGKLKSKSIANSEYGELFFDRSECPKSLEYFNDKKIDWEVIDKYCDNDRSKVLEERFMSEKLDKLEWEIERQKQKYLHLCIEVRPYLWT